ncbi:hypothetical protein N865_03965 [Intrasporangium oryzae NRRL B-24470]|uniref:Uncharacterized protein n=1 Tax=Intrasporangium oryzae NRRL B-24470 TaxID=1386089 RepID=W9GAN1_9MICO|nr:hypothetical protein [Intrasporangium oryzae]EWT03105.1 hypothetical protein N865_03965 [Intrasporangium oryzae NRRL B-24470]
MATTSTNWPTWKPWPDVLAILAPAIVVAAAFGAAVVSTGTTWSTAFWWLGVMLFGVLVPGLALVRAARRRPATLRDDAGWAGPAGLLVALAGWLIGHLLQDLVGHRPGPMTWGLVVTALLGVVPATRRRLVARPAPSKRSFVAPALVAAAMLGAVKWAWTGGLSSAPAIPESTTRYSQDVVYQVALTGELRRSLRPGYPPVAGEPLDYHWFFHAVAAHLGGDGLHDLDVVARLLPLSLILMLIGLAAVVGRQVVDHAAGGPGAALAVALMLPIRVDPFRPPASWALGIYWQPSPTQTLAWVWGLALAACIIAVVRRRPSDASAPVLLLPLFALGASGAKASEVPVVAGGVALAALVWLLLSWRRPLADGTLVRYVVVGIVCMVAVAVGVLFLYPGSYGLQWDPQAVAVKAQSMIHPGSRLTVSGAWKWIVLTSGWLAQVWVPIMIPALLLLVLVRRDPRDPTPWIATGAALVGLVTLVVFTHPGSSQWYFTLGAVPIVLALSGAAGGWVVAQAWASRSASVRGAALGLVVAGSALVVLVRRLSGAQPRSAEGASAWVAPLGWFALAVVAVTVVGWAVGRARGVRVRGLALAATALVIMGAALPSSAANLATLPAARGHSTARPTDVPTDMRALFLAGQYLRRAAAPDDIVATNRIYQAIMSSGKDARDFTVAAFSGLRTDVSGWAYSGRILAEGARTHRYYVTLPFWDPPRLAAELALITDPTPSGFASAWQHGVRWIVADERAGPVSPTLGTLSDERFEQDGVQVFRLRPPAA